MRQLFATFDHSHYVELAISKLTENEIRDIYAVPLDKRINDMKLVDTIHGTDGTSLVDIGLILAMMFGTIGVARGFVLDWGPVYWGLIGAAGGFTIGFAFDLIKLIKRKKIRAAKTKQAEVILIVKCKADQSKFVEQTLCGTQGYMGVAKTRIQPSDSAKPPISDRRR